MIASELEALEREVARFLHREARLLDEGAWEAWLDLYAEDAVYWVPGQAGQTDPLDTVSILYEDKEILGMRLRRLQHARAYSLDPPVRTTHLLGNIEVAEEAGEIVARSVLHVTAYRPDEDRRLFSGRALHRLIRSGDGLLILQKRIDLVDCDGIHPGLISVPF